MGDYVNARIAGRIRPGARARKRRGARIAGACVAILGMVLWSAAAGIESPAHAQSQTAAVGLSDSDINSALDAQAKLFAKAVTDKQFRLTIRDSVAARFAGEPEVLWKDLAKKPPIRGTLAANVARESNTTTPTAQQAVDHLANRIPRFQIAVPANFDTWNAADYAPLVAYAPEGVDDTTLKTVTAYDAAGRIFQLDAQAAPERPVIVLGLNERTDDSGNLLKSQQAIPNPPISSDSESSTDASTSAAAPKTYEVAITFIQLWHDKEPWFKGDAEISMKAKSRGCSGTEYTDSDWERLDNDLDRWSTIDGKRVLGSTKCDVVFYWWEDDGGGADFELGYGGFTLGVKMDDDDDLIGGIQLAHNKFQGASIDTTDWSDLEMSTH